MASARSLPARAIKRRRDSAGADGAEGLARGGPKFDNSFFEHAVSNHVASFSQLVETGLEAIVNCLAPCVVEIKDGSNYILNLTELQLGLPTKYVGESGGEHRDPKLYPSDCRLGHISYAATLTGKFSLRHGSDASTISASVPLGEIPVMVRSKACNLHGLSPKELVRRREDETEVGGYFILNGLERVIRMLVMPRANYPMAITRPSYQNRGKLYTPHATLMRCLRPDGSTLTNSLHYLQDGSCTLRFSTNKEEWLIPLVLVAKSVYDVSDGLLLELLGGSGSGKGGLYLQERAAVLLQQQNAKQPIASKRHAQQLLGSSFRSVLREQIPSTCSDQECGAYITRQFFFVHTDDGWQKLLTLCCMYQKLIGLVRNQVEPDNQDAFSSHEVLLPGQLYGMVLKEAVEVVMIKARGFMLKLIKQESEKKGTSTAGFVPDTALLSKVITVVADVGKRMEHFLATGNVTSRSGLDLMQVSGYTVVADKLNHARFSSHFVAIHRGQYFSEMKTTTVRKLLPETWGFLCPVHTPDGAPCGLLNHFAHSARAIIKRPSPRDAAAVLSCLAALGAEIWPEGGAGGLPQNYASGAGVTTAWVMLDGKPVGHISFKVLEQVATQLRALKVDGQCGVPKDMEIACITKEWQNMFPGLFLFLGPGRMVRPVQCLRSGQVELIGPLEQLFLGVAALRSERIRAHATLRSREAGKPTEELPEFLPMQYTHEELRPTEIFSVLASMTPFSNHNQSPRNMYQCQMLKQTMGTPYHNHVYRCDNKIYRIYCPQKPIVRTQVYNQAQFDTHPQGTNAVVAVITYTGYDMEDAMVINKGSWDRGFKHGMVYKTKIIEAAKKDMKVKEQKAAYFGNIKAISSKGKRERVCEEMDSDGDYKLEDDGFPPLGRKVTKGDPICAIIQPDGNSFVETYHDDEDGYVEQVTLVDNEVGPPKPNQVQGKRALLKLRIQRKPVVGDKFSSRHGQKGVMSILWPSEDMPYTESGITPDILFNPHGFPSRMTIGMLIESIAAKTAAIEGRPTADGTTFRDYRGTFASGDDNEGDPFPKRKMTPEDRKNAQGPTAAEYFARTLVQKGFQRLGTERMYSGIHGTEMETDIFVGVVYYQRLRHMVNEKAQVRARGPVDRITNQPVKGRKRHGGIRFGEMERDSLLAHGTSFLLHDRLMRCSDYDVAYVCRMCGSIITPQANAQLKTGAPTQRPSGENWECPPCSEKTGKPVVCYQLPIPWVFRYLTVEMAAMGIKVQMNLKDWARQASLTSMPPKGSSGADGDADEGLRDEDMES